LVGKDDWSDEVSEEWDKLCDVDGYEVESKI